MTRPSPRLIIASRIYGPEPAAASFVLDACARAFRDAGWDVRVLTTRYRDAPAREDADGVRIARAPVKRNAAGYVRGYVSYLSFDLPLFFRLLFARRADLVLVEPPPTTGAVVRLATSLRGIPYVYDAADLWSDAARSTTGNRFVLRALRAVERFAIRGARHAFVVAEVYAERMRAIGIATPTSVSGFGVDTGAFDYRASAPREAPLFVYGGSYSEWHGARIFVDALPRLRETHPTARVLFVGNGAERANLERRAADLGVTQAVEFRDTVPPAELAGILASATASLASLAPSGAYEYAFVTKIYASLASGCPVVYTGVGPTGPFLREAGRTVKAGVVAAYDPGAVAQALAQMASEPADPAERRELSRWTRENHSLQAVARRFVAESEAAIRPRLA